MDDDNGLELSLGLSCGGSFLKLKSKTGSFSDNRTEEGERANKSGDDLKNFLHSGVLKQDSGTRSQGQGSESVKLKPQESFFNDLSRYAINGDASLNLNGRGGHLVINANWSAEHEVEKRPEIVNKHRNFFSEINHQKKREREGYHSDVHDRTTSHISITTEDGRTTQNEDVAESEVEVSTSRMVSDHEHRSKLFIGAGVSSEGQKKARGYISSSENEFKIGNLIGAVPFSIQSVNVMNAPCSIPTKESISVVTSSESTHPQASRMQVMPAANFDQSGSQPVPHGNLPIVYGYSPVQLPMLNKDNVWGSVSHPQQLLPSLAATDRDQPNSGAVQVISHTPSEASQFDAKKSEQIKGGGKQHATREGSSFQAGVVKEINMNFRPKDASDRSSPERFSLDFSAIKPGISKELKFGGCGSYPDLPWVSTTGPGPNGRTIFGVTYKYSANQIRIVCACHGFHMSPEEFSRHAIEDHVNPGIGNGLATLPNSNPAASSQS